MKNEKVCVKKSLLYIALAAVVFLIGVALFSNYMTSQNYSTGGRAASACAGIWRTDPNTCSGISTTTTYTEDFSKQYTGADGKVRHCCVPEKKAAPTAGGTGSCSAPGQCYTGADCAAVSTTTGGTYVDSTGTCATGKVCCKPGNKPASAGGAAPCSAPGRCYTGADCAAVSTATGGTYVASPGTCTGTGKVCCKPGNKAAGTGVVACKGGAAGCTTRANCSDMGNWVPDPAGDAWCGTGKKCCYPSGVKTYQYRICDTANKFCKNASKAYADLATCTTGEGVTCYTSDAYCTPACK